MAKIHTHYDNLKVARMAPQEVIRAAYKALSQKYHPDKNPGDEKAARIMAIINSAYGTLADPQRRREHDEWIVAEEWEIEWLESTRQEDGRASRGHDVPSAGWEEMGEGAALPVRRRTWQVVVALAACLLLGWLLAFLMFGPARWLPASWGSWFGLPAESAAAVPPAETLALAAPTGEVARLPGARDLKNEAAGEAIIDSWAVGRASSGETRKPPVRVQAVAQVVLSSEAVDCEPGGQTLVAPNGEAWPSASGYISGFPVGNQGSDLQLTLNNSDNPLPVFIKLYDLERHSNVRYVFILPHEQWTIPRLALGRYEIRYQNIDLNGTGKDGCTPAHPGVASKAGAAA